MATSSFAALLRQHRQALGLTQEELAERAGLSARAISDLERGRKQAPRPSTVRLLVQGLGLGTADAARLLAATQGREQERLPSGAEPAPGHLPRQLTSFIGREHELTEVRALLPTTPLLTLVGPGGVGKTRLALEVARSVVGHYPDGLWLVELAPLVDAGLVAHRVGAVLGARETAEQPIMSALASAVTGRRLLLVLDNCEHVLRACAVLVDALLRACPELHIFGTSREPLSVDGELTWRVPSLPVPDACAAQSLARLEQNAAVHLFTERARAVQPHFALTTRNAGAVVEICRRLDGLPLALELAAARIDALTAEQLAARLDQRFRLLTGGSPAALPRQQTLGATLDWSYELLSRPEQCLLERLSVFVGAWTLEAGEAVGAGGELSAEDVLELLLRLVRRSLVMAEEQADGTNRYRLLETVREYAHQKLAARGTREAAAARTRHAAFYSTQAQHVDPALPTGPARHAGDATATPLLARLDAMQEDLHAALGWWLEAARPAEGLALAVTLGFFWMWRGMYVEGRRWLAAMLELDERRVAASARAHTQQAVPAALRARALSIAGMLASRQGDYQEARRLHEASVQLWRRLDNPKELADALSWVALDLWFAGERAAATALLDEGLRLGRAAGDSDSVAMSLRNLGVIARSEAHHERAAALFQEAAAEARSLGWSRGYPYARAIAHLGRVQYLRGDCESASLLLKQALGCTREAALAGHTLADCLDWLAAVEGAVGRPARAAQLFGAAEAHWRASGAVRYAPEQAAYERDVVAVRAVLQEDVFTAAWARGRLLSHQEAVAYALAEQMPEPATARRNMQRVQAAGGLTPANST